MNLELKIEKEWSKEVGTVASHFLEKDRQIIVLDSDYVSNAPRDDVINAIVHESIHGILAEMFQGQSNGNVDSDLKNSYTKYDNIQDFVEFWRAPKEVWDPKVGDMIERGETIGIWKKWKPIIERLVALIIALLMISSLATWLFH